jgi:hypothetical protein
LAFELIAALFAQAAPALQESELERVLVRFVLPFATAAGAFWLSRLQARKEQRLGQASIEATTRAEISAERGKLAEQWAGTTDRMRDLLDAAYAQLAVATTRAVTAEARAGQLERELADVQRQHLEAQGELERLRRRVSRRTKTRDDR